MIKVPVSGEESRPLSAAYSHAHLPVLSGQKNALGPLMIFVSSPLPLCMLFDHPVRRTAS